jgi:hypothetical protein
MFDFKKIEASTSIDKDFVLKRINEEHIFTYYHGPFQFGKVYPSKFRKEKHPSCGFYINPKGKLIYNDIAKRLKYDCFDFVCAMYSITFKEAVEKVAFDFGLIDGKPKPVIKKILYDLKDFDRTAKKETTIHFSARKWDSDGLKFWDQFHITENELKRDGYYYINNLFINGKKIYNKDNEIRFALTTTVDGDMRTKVYSPYSSSLKWITNIPTAHPFGLEDLDKSASFCFVAKSAKCRTVLKKFLPAVIAIQSEQPSAISEEVDQMLQFQYDRVYLGADNDETGLSFMEEMEPKGYIPMGLPEGWPKDYSDLSRDKGLKAVEKVLKQKNLI